MVNITAILTGTGADTDDLRYSPGAAHARQGVGPGRGPVVAWNVTTGCNLHCRHCYSEAGVAGAADELDTAAAREVLDDLARYQVPVVLFTGGEPLCRPDLIDLVAHATSRGLRCAISTNGTLLDDALAHDLRRAGLAYAGISIDGPEKVHDEFRGRRGAWQGAVAGAESCRRAGIKVGFRFTITRGTAAGATDLFGLAKETGVGRLCFYHLVATGRGRNLAAEDLDAAARRDLLDSIAAAAVRAAGEGTIAETLTVNNHADAIYLYLRCREDRPDAAARALSLIRRQGGNRSGVAIAGIDHRGDVHPDQFTRQYTLGNVTRTTFAEIWANPDSTLLAALRDRHRHLKGRCRACRWLRACGGNFRARAAAVTGDFWAADPGCYLTDEEIGLAGA